MSLRDKISFLGPPSGFPSSVLSRSWEEWAYLEGNTRLERTSYVASVGTCRGDSGGPSFIKDGSNFVVTGEVLFC